MKEKQYKSFKIPTLVVQIFDGKFASFSDEKGGRGKDNTLWIDNENYAYELYRLLKKADEVGAFDHITEDTEDSKIDVTYI